MPLAPETLAIIQKHLDGKLKKCPMCEGHKQWVIESEAMALIKWALSAPTGVAGGMDLSLMFPVIAIYCDYCGLTLQYFLNQIMRSANAG
jgi:hypothetical protein